MTLLKIPNLNSSVFCMKFNKNAALDKRQACEKTAFFVNFINLIVKFLSKFIKFAVKRIWRTVLNFDFKFNRFFSALKSRKI
ncbi:hypothetical protein [Campylobacter showae]|uniref:hypothetical protein n=1 Tax=Campylobacter showae TaxID=204 RepID=UPI0003117298|nr:hypothetical protein [Campylobacter showae]